VLEMATICPHAWTTTQSGAGGVQFALRAGSLLQAEVEIRQVLESSLMMVSESLRELLCPDSVIGFEQGGYLR
jgi:hypothetical protein